MPAIDATAVEQALDNWAAQLLQTAREHPESLAIVGLVSHGDMLAQRLVQRLQAAGCEARYGAIDITLYRDDLDLRNERPALRSSHLPFSTDDMRLVLVDDVIATGRTIRAALEVIFEYGRPAHVELHCLADRGGRELPIQPDLVQFRLEVPADQRISVRLKEIDGVDEISY